MTASQPPTLDELRPERRLIVALDLRDEGDVLPLVDRLGDEVSFYKVGYPRVFHAGLRVVEELKARGKDVFVDLKFFDVPETVANCVRAVRDAGAALTTIHGNAANVAAARAEAGGDLKILGVTMLTSLGRADVKHLYGVDDDVEHTVVEMARFLVAKGCDGVVASPREARRLREAPDAAAFLIVTPGVRLRGGATHDHARSGEPRRAIADGADYIVVGRPIYDPPSGRGPRDVALDYIEEIRAGLGERVDGRQGEQAGAEPM